MAVLVAEGEGEGFVRTFRRLQATLEEATLDVFLHEGARVVVRPWFPGKRLDETPKQPLLSACATLDPVARMLARAHRAGLADRALGPSRVVVSETAVLLDATLAALSEVPPDPSHAAPELLDRRPADARADVYALALLFLELASGKNAYGEIESTELHARATDRSERPTLRALGVAASARVERVLERALAVDPELRFPEAASFWEALREGVVAAPAEEASFERPPLREIEVVKHARSESAPLRIVLPITVGLVAAVLGVEAILHRAPAPPRAAVVASAPSPAPSPIVSASAPIASAPIASASAAPEPIVPSSLMLPVPAESPAFFVDRTEVTVGAFRACVKAGMCAETPKRGPGWSEDDPVRREWLCNYHRKGREDHPINCVSLAQATAYCGFVGKRIPSAEEWTRAARGDDKRIYPWGDALPRCGDVVYARYGPDNPGCSKHPPVTEPVGRTAGASPFGAQDMAGSLWEWTTETSHGLAVLRGGAWDSPERGVTIDARLEQSPGNADVTLGFRCVRDP
ncbi:MAG: SUMF1/EgtB/PvdO family nonheme iron enzyme [Polyangiales bacterium]